MEFGEGAEWEFELGLAVLDEAVRRALFFAGMTSATEAAADEGVVDPDPDAGADMYGEDDEVREDAYPPWALYEPAPGRTMRPG